MFAMSPATLAGQWTVPRMPEAVRFVLLALIGAAGVASGLALGAEGVPALGDVGVHAVEDGAVPARAGTFERFTYANAAGSRAYAGAGTPKWPSTARRSRSGIVARSRAWSSTVTPGRMSSCSWA